MSWKPSWSHVVVNHRIDPFRERGAHLEDANGTVVGRVFIHVEAWAELQGGHFWWRRWSTPDERLWSYWELQDDSSTDDHPSGPDDAESDLAALEAGHFKLSGDTYRLRWMDTRSSRELAQYLEVPPAP